MSAMSEPTVDVLDREIAARNLGPSGHAVGCVEHPPGARFPCSCNGPQLIALHAAVAELVEADREYDKARATWDRIKSSGLDPDEPAYQHVRQTMHAAIVYRAAALARFGSIK